MLDADEDFEYKLTYSSQMDRLTISAFEAAPAGSSLRLKFPGFEIGSPHILFLVGKNGAGKTTFLDHLRRNPHLLGLDGATSSLLYLEQFYDNLIFPYQPVWWNICLPIIVKGGVSPAAMRSLAADQLEHFGLNVNLNLFSNKLSGGEKHLILIMRMLLSDHQVLLLDEPTVGVDVDHFERLWEIVHQVTHACTKWIILTSHTQIPLFTVQKELHFSGLNNEILTIRAAN